MRNLILLFPFNATILHGATVIIHPSTIAYINSPNQEFTPFLDNENHIIDGSGLNATPTVGNITSVSHESVSFNPSGNAWATISTGSDFFATGGNPPMFTIDLGSTFSVTGVVVWGYHFGFTYSGNQPKNITLEFSTNGGVSYGSPFSLDIPITSNYNTSSIMEFPSRLANHVRMTITDNYFGVHTGGDRVGIAEIRFMGDAIPEQGGILLPSIGALVLLRRKRQTAS